MSDNFRFAQLQPFSLAGAGAVIGDVTVTLKSMKDIDGNAVTMAGTFGTIGFGTLNPGSGTLEEQISFSDLINNANGTTTLTGVKSVSFVYPYTQTTGLLKTHSGSAPFVISNTAGFYDELTSKADDETITGLWTFNTLPQSPATPTNNADLTTKQYVDGVAIAGAPLANDTTTGIVRIATRAQMAAGSASTVAFVLESARSSATGASGTTVAVISQTNGKIDPAFIDGTGNYSYSGTNTFAGATILSGSTSIAGVTLTGTSTNAGALVGFYDYQLFTSSGTWTKPAKLAGTELVHVQAWGGGGGGGTAGGTANGTGGGGGSYTEAKFRASDLGDTVTVTVGGSSTIAGIGNNSTFGSLLTAYGGGAGQSNTASGAGGGGAGVLAKGSSGSGSTGGTGGAPAGSAAGAANAGFGGGGGGGNAQSGGVSAYGGGGGAGLGLTGGGSYYGGGGGGAGNNAAGGVSVLGGNGGAGGSTSAGNPGVAPGGGGGGADGNGNTGGLGARGEIRVWVMK